MGFKAPAFHGPSLQTMEAGRRRKTFALSNIFGDPFALATVSIALLGWILAFVASIVTAVSHDYPRWGWWTLGYMFVFTVGVTVVLGAASMNSYHVAIVGYASAGIVMTSSAVQQTIYSNVAAEEAAAAGFILLAIISPQATHRTYVDSFALQKESRPSARTSRQMSGRFNDPNAPFPPNGPQRTVSSSNHLNGFENSAPNGYTARESQLSQPRFGGAAGQPFGGPPASVPTEDGSVSVAADYKYRAKAIYSYEANPEDANEVSFTKGEILEVSDVSGRWWQARKTNGETGIAPSNYLILL